MDFIYVKFSGDERFYAAPESKYDYYRKHMYVELIVNADDEVIWDAQDAVRGKRGQDYWA